MGVFEGNQQVENCLLEGLAEGVHEYSDCECMRGWELLALLGLFELMLGVFV